VRLLLVGSPVAPPPPTALLRPLRAFMPLLLHMVLLLFCAS
jgi:hypothetical protein